MADRETAASAVIGLLMMPWVGVIRGLTFAKLWAWFVVAKFGLPPLRIPEALGIALIASFLVTNEAKASDQPLWVLCLGHVGICLVALAMGWIYLRF